MTPAGSRRASRPAPSPARAAGRVVFGLLALGILASWAFAPAPATAQQKIGYIDSDYILQKLPEYATVQQKLDRLEDQWRGEIESARQEVDRLQDEFQARELLYTDEERTRKQEAIQEAKQRVQELRRRYFGPDGELYSRQKELMRPIQERVLTAVEEVATAEGYDYVFDRSGDYLFMYAREQYNLSDDVLRELGINVDRQDQQNAQRRSDAPAGGAGQNLLDDRNRQDRQQQGGGGRRDGGGRTPF